MTKDEQSRYSKLINRIASKTARIYFVSAADLAQEGWVALLHCLGTKAYQGHRDQMKYLSTVVRRSMMQAACRIRVPVKVPKNQEYSYINYRSHYLSTLELTQRDRHISQDLAALIPKANALVEYLDKANGRHRRGALLALQRIQERFESYQP